jgi:hypothetical protein
MCSLETLNVYDLPIKAQLVKWKQLLFAFSS